MFDKNEKMFKE